MLEAEGHLDLANVTHFFCLHFVFLPRLQLSLDLFRQGWDNHALRTEQNMTPNQLWELGQIQHPIHDPEVDKEPPFLGIKYIVRLLDCKRNTVFGTWFGSWLWTHIGTVLWRKKNTSAKCNLIWVFYYCIILVNPEVKMHYASLFLLRSWTFQTLIGSRVGMSQSPTMEYKFLSSQAHSIKRTSTYWRNTLIHWGHHKIVV